MIQNCVVVTVPTAGDVLNTDLAECGVPGMHLCLKQNVSSSGVALTSNVHNAVHVSYARASTPPYSPRWTDGTARK